MRKNPKRRGEMGEISFLHRATNLGFRVSKPFGDSDPYDFIVDNGRRRWLVQEVQRQALRQKRLPRQRRPPRLRRTPRRLPPGPLPPRGNPFPRRPNRPRGHLVHHPSPSSRRARKPKNPLPSAPQKRRLRELRRSLASVTGRASRRVRPKYRPAPKRSHNHPHPSTPQTHLTSKRSSHPGAPGSRRPLSLTWEPIRRRSPRSSPCRASIPARRF